MNIGPCPQQLRHHVIFDDILSASRHIETHLLLLKQVPAMHKLRLWHGLDRAGGFDRLGIVSALQTPSNNLGLLDNMVQTVRLVVKQGRWPRHTTATENVTDRKP